MTDVRRGITISVEQQLVTEICCNCGMVFAMTEDLQRRLRAKPGTSFYCPAGHSQHYTGKTEAQKLREQLDEERRERQRAEQRIAYYSDRRREAEQEAEHQRRRANGYKGQATKLAKRAKAGVCPCCNRSFENLRRHMATQHPSFQAPSLEDAAPANGVPA